MKTAELRTRGTRIIGQRFWIYASKKKLPVVSGRFDVAHGGQWSVKTADNIVAPNEPLPEWMIELAEQVRMIEPGAILPPWVIVGSAVIARVERVNSQDTSHNSQKSSSGDQLTTLNDPPTTLFR